MSFKLQFTRNAKDDFEKLKMSNLRDKGKELLRIIQENPLKYPPEYEKLKGLGNNIYARRINKQHRLVYSIEGETITIRAMWTHYETMK